MPAANSNGDDEVYFFPLEPARNPYAIPGTSNGDDEVYLFPLEPAVYFFPSSPRAIPGTSNGDDEVYLFPLEPARDPWHTARLSLA